jgi:hypothetical protein
MCAGEFCRGRACNRRPPRQPQREYERKSHSVASGAFGGWLSLHAHAKFSFWWPGFASSSDTIEDKAIDFYRRYQRNRPINCDRCDHRVCCHRLTDLVLQPDRYRNPTGCIPELPYGTLVFIYVYKGVYHNCTHCFDFVNYKIIQCSVRVSSST